MWKIYFLFGFDNFFVQHKEKLTHQLKTEKVIEISSSKKDFSNFRTKEITPINKYYSDDDVSNLENEHPFEYPPPENKRKTSIFSKFDLIRNEVLTDYLGKANDILKELLLKNESSLNDFELIYEDKIKPENLKIYLKSYLNSEKHRINIYRSEWKIPCSPEFFLEFMNDTPFQITLDPNIKEFLCFENLGTDIFLMYLLYKKMFIVDSRDFVYLKHYKLLDEKNQVWGYTTKSITHENYPQLKDKIRGEILLSGNIIKQIGEQESIVNLYSEINLKINLPVILMKSKTICEMKKYIESFLQYLNKKKKQN